MTTYVALLRAINLGTRRKVPMSDLRDVLAGAGYGDVTTHLQTGNVVLQSEVRNGSTLAAELETTLAAAFGFNIDVMLRTAREMAKIAKANPFLRRRIDPSTLAVGFLKARPSAPAGRLLDGTDFAPEEFTLAGAELYLRYPNGLGRAKMSGAFFERTLATPTTVRNWSVVTKLVEISRG